MNDQTLSLAERICLKDFAGRTLTLNSSFSAWEALGHNGEEETVSDILLLGVAPGNLEGLPFVRTAINKGGNIYWLEAPETIQQLKLHNLPIPPENTTWKRVDTEWLKEANFLGEIFFYTPGRRLAPTFWGKLLAQIEIKKHKSQESTPASQPKTIAWLPGNRNQLLHQELEAALLDNGFDTIFSDLPTAPDLASLEKIWQRHVPDFVLSINFRGLDPEGRIFEICRGLNIPLAIWLVDNPWHILSGVRYPWWREARLFITDPGFITSLQNCGARHVTFCPLAAAQHMWQEIPDGHIPNPLFVGRSEFPAKLSFFGNMKIEPSLVTEALAYYNSHARYPGYHWWSKKFQETPWPGKGSRKTGFYADVFSARNRAEWVMAAKDTGIKIIGDEGWKKYIPACQLEPQVDYYGKLANIYRASQGVLNVTSLLLPGSLNQRHFDVWATGSMLYTDKTDGIALFPFELTEPITLDCPHDFPERVSFWQTHEARRKDLIVAWRECLKASHQYTHRIEMIRKALAGKNMEQGDPKLGSEGGIQFSSI